MSEKWKEREGGTEGGRRGGGAVSSAVCPTPHPKTPRDSQLARMRHEKRALLGKGPRGRNSNVPKIQ